MREQLLLIAAERWIARFYLTGAVCNAEEELAHTPTRI